MDSPCGRAVKTRSAPPVIFERSLPTNCMSVTPLRLGWTLKRYSPAYLLEVANASSTLPCPSSSRRSSPPAYPDAPSTPTRTTISSPPASRTRSSSSRSGARSRLRALELDGVVDLVDRIAASLDSIASTPRMPPPTAFAALQSDVLDLLVQLERRRGRLPWRRWSSTLPRRRSCRRRR